MASPYFEFGLFMKDKPSELSCIDLLCNKTLYIKLLHVHT